LIGIWYFNGANLTYSVGSTDTTVFFQGYNTVHQFYGDGTFESEHTTGYVIGEYHRVVGKYSVSDGKVYLTELKRVKVDVGRFHKREDFSNEYKNIQDIVMEYGFGSDDKGDYLLISDFHRAYTETTTYIDNSNYGKTFRKTDENPIKPLF